MSGEVKLPDYLTLLNRLLSKTTNSLNTAGSQTGSDNEHATSKLGPINYIAAFHGVTMRGGGLCRTLHR
jgi:hypothetical protein